MSRQRASDGGGGTSVRRGSHRGVGRIVRRTVRRAFRVLILAAGFYLTLAVFLLALYGLVSPPTTGVQIQRKIEALVAGDSPSLLWTPVPSERISGHLLHAVVAAEDGRFYGHFGIDPQAVRQALDDNQTRGRMRGGSTITQQLVKNLFLTTGGGWLRKALEVPLALAADAVLTKDRQLELYMNVIEWGTATFGAEEAAKLHYATSAATLSRSQAAGLAALLPSPRTRNPANTGWYRSIILRRMDQMGY